MNSSARHSLFERWLADHAAILHHVARGFAEGADRDDLMQELLLALWRAAPAFRGDAQSATFVYRVAHNTALTWKRAQTGYRRRVDRFEALMPPADAASHAAGEGERLEQIYAEVRKMPPLDRSLLLLHFDGVPYATMAEIHGLTEGNVGVRLSRLKQKLITALQPIAHELR